MKAKFKAGDRVRVGLPGEARELGQSSKYRGRQAHSQRRAVRRERQYLIRLESDEPLLIREKYPELVN